MLDPIIERIERAATRDDLQRAAVALRDHYRIRHVAYQTLGPDQVSGAIGTVPAEWAERYRARGYLRVDPVVRRCLTTNRPVDRKSVAWRGKPARALWRDAQAFGLGTQGYAVPLRGAEGRPAIFAASDDRHDADWAAFLGANRRDLMLVAHVLNDRAIDLDCITDDADEWALSPREIDALTCLARGYSRAQASETLAISEHTLRTYIESARRKLDAINTTHAVARALSRGLIVV